MLRLVAVAAAVIPLLAVATVLAQVYTETSTVDGVTVTFSGPDTAQGRADIAAEKAGFDADVASSATLKDNVLASGNTTVEVDRSGAIKIGDSNATIRIDPGDIERMGQNLTGGTAADRGSVDANLRRTIRAHEWAEKATKGHAGAITDENATLSELATGVQRDGDCKVRNNDIVQDFTVDGTTVTVNISDANPAGQYCGLLEEASVGGIAELPVNGADAPARAAEGSGSSAPPYAALAGAAAALVAMAAGGWYARRRLS